MAFPDLVLVPQPQDYPQYTYVMHNINFINKYRVSLFQALTLIEALRASIRFEAP
jgi:hypothetical protein